ncbi:MAG: hypothetical protein AAF626_15990 [Pseudomonadota bacterium]
MTDKSIAVAWEIMRTQYEYIIKVWEAAGEPTDTIDPDNVDQFKRELKDCDTKIQWRAINETMKDNDRELSFNEKIYQDFIDVVSNNFNSDYFEYVKKPISIKSIIKRGRIRNNSEYRRIMDEISDVENNSLGEDEIKTFNAMLLKFENN